MINISQAILSSSAHRALDVEKFHNFFTFQVFFKSLLQVKFKEKLVWGDHARPMCGTLATDNEQQCGPISSFYGMKLVDGLYRT